MDKRYLLGLVFLLSIAFVSAFSIDNTKIESAGLNTNITINQTVYMSVLDVQDTYINLTDFQAYTGTEYLEYDLYITASNAAYVYNSSRKDFPYIQSSTDATKVVNNTYDLINVTLKLSTGYCGTVETVDTVTVSNGTVQSWDCTNSTLTINMELGVGQTVITLEKAAGERLLKNWIRIFSSMFALLIVVVFLFVALGYLAPITGRTIETGIDFKSAVIMIILSAILFAAAIVIFSSMGI
jgi:hypothetical protein